MISRYWKAIIGVVSAIAAALISVQSDPNVVDVLPASVTGWLGVVAVPAIGGLLAYLKRQLVTVDQIDTAVKSGDISVADLKDLIARWQTLKP